MFSCVIGTARSGDDTLAKDAARPNSTVAVAADISRKASRIRKQSRGRHRRDATLAFPSGDPSTVDNLRVPDKCGADVESSRGQTADKSRELPPPYKCKDPDLLSLVW